MSIRFKIFLAFSILFVFVIFQITNSFRNDVRKSYLESLEENMVDSANILAEITAGYYRDDKFDLSFLRNAMLCVAKRKPEAQIYKLLKNKIDANIYVTDNNGKVLFNSHKPKSAGHNFANWNDVNKCLVGRYGARSTRLNKDDPTTSVLYVAAPIKVDGKLVGVLTFIKPLKFTSFFIEERKNKLVKIAVFISMIAFLIFIIFSEWITAPVLRLTKYVKTLSAGESHDYPHLGRGEISRLGAAFEEMRLKLDGKKYIEDYVRTLTHELKSPISAVRGAVELLEDTELPPKQGEKFLAIISHENERMSEQVDRMLQLSRLEGHSAGAKTEEVDIALLVNEVVLDCEILSMTKRNFKCNVAGENLILFGDRFLIKEALNNLVRNAIDFTDKTGTIELKAFRRANKIRIEVIDNGIGIPDYAHERIFEKFYSLARPASGQKSSGLGLSIVRQIAILHNGEISLQSNNPKGTKAILELPCSRSHFHDTAGVNLF
ncbi:MAG: two-component system sensor histidine kinase CreC [Victivallales bacterium]|nr:two-component system sensor histidine kinase CreC [Victivallales bacterium]